MAEGALWPDWAMGAKGAIGSEGAMKAVGAEGVEGIEGAEGGKGLWRMSGLLYIWVNFSRTGKMVKMWHFLELCSD